MTRRYPRNPSGSSFDRLKEAAEAIWRNHIETGRPLRQTFVDRYLEAEREARAGRTSRSPLSPLGTEGWPVNARNGGTGISDGSPAPVDALRQPGDRNALTAGRGIRRGPRQGKG
jgi:hypothetical protein